MTEANSEKRRIYDGMDVIQERNLYDTNLATYVRDGNIGGLLSKEDMVGNRFYYHYDGSGNVTELTDNQQNTVAQYSYDAWGNVQTQTGTQRLSGVLMAQEIHLELLIGQVVRDANGRSAGRIQEALARKENGEWIVTEFHLGSGAVLERFSIRHLGLAALGVLGAKKIGGARCVPWDKMDLSDPSQPRLRCALEELPARKK